MNIEQLDRIEAELGISLPEAYRELMLHYPFPEKSGNSDSSLFDDEAAIIDLGKKYHRGFAGLAPWPKHLFFVGDDGAASCYALDLSDPSLQVLFLDHGNCREQRVVAASLEVWVKALSGEADQNWRVTPPAGKTEKVLWLIVLAILVLLFGGVLAYRLVTGKPL
jgi:hypothetical protein